MFVFLTDNDVAYRVI